MLKIGNCNLCHKRMESMIAIGTELSKQSVQVTCFKMSLWPFAYNHKTIKSLLKRKEDPAVYLFSSSHCSDESSIHSATDGENNEKVKEGRAGMRAGE